jgi:hypothetical protein
LTPVEESLVEHVCQGEPLDLAKGQVIDEAAMRSWGDDRTCRATVIRDILRGRLAPDPDPHGLRLRGARISGQLDLDNLSTDVNLDLCDCLLEDGVFARDARLASVSLAGCRTGPIAQRDRPPLDATRLTCSVLILTGARIIGHAERGAVDLIGARIGGSLDCAGAELRNDSGPALSADSLQVDQALHLTDGFTATGSGADVAVDLTGTRVGGTLVFDPASLEHAADPHRRLAVDGLTYAGVPQQISARDWLDLLRDATPGYAAQPYQQLAAGYRALGAERQAREILIAQRNDELTRADTRWAERLWGSITGVTLGYGYQLWRPPLVLAWVVVLSCVLALVLGSHGALTQTDKTTSPGRPCTVAQQVSVGLDLNLPVGASLARADCDLTKNSASATAAWLAAVGWVLRLLAWVFAALFIAGFTTAIRKT